MLTESWEQACGTNPGRNEFGFPAVLTKAMVSLVQPTADDSIYDPACGRGDLLCGLQQSLQLGSGSAALFGQEQNGLAGTLARLRLCLHEKWDARIKYGKSALTDPEFPMRYPSEANAYDETGLRRFDVV